MTPDTASAPKVASYCENTRPDVVAAPVGQVLDAFDDERFDTIEDAGWHVERISHPALGRTKALDRLTGGRSTEFTFGQRYVLARLAGDAPAER